MPTIAEMIRLADNQIRRKWGVNAGLERAASSAGRRPTDTPRLLAERRQALEEAVLRLDELIADVEHMSTVLPYLPEGWPAEHESIRRAIAADPPTGVGRWLNYWLTAASRRRIEAMYRLQSDVPLPPGGVTLAARVDTATRALADGDWSLSHEILESACGDLHLGAWKGIESGVQEDIRLLIARVALRRGLPDRADAILRAGPGELTSAAALALRSRSARARNDVGAADALLSRARELDPRDLDVTAESIRLARQYGKPDLALDDARAAAEGFLSLGDLEADLDRLVDVPNELYVALAERARAKDDGDCALRLLNRAAAQHDAQTVAMVEEGRAALLPRYSADRRAALLSAGRWRIGMGQLERARSDFDAVIVASRDQHDMRVRAMARLYLAAIVAMTEDQHPDREMIKKLAGAISTLLKAQKQVDVGGRESWSYLTESSLRGRLARLRSTDRYAQEWGAFHAAARAVALNPQWVRAWLRLSESAQALSLYRWAEASAARGYCIAEGDEQGEARDGYVLALTNCGRFEEALTLLKDATSEAANGDWNRCVRGYIATELGEPGEAIRYFAAGDIDPRWTWAWRSYVTALAMTGDLALAREFSSSFLQAAAGRLSEREQLTAVAFDACVQGRPADALQPARRLHGEDLHGEITGLRAWGIARVLAGDVAGWELLATAISTDASPAAAGAWEHRWRPLLTVLAGERGLSLDFARMDAALDHARVRAAAGDALSEVRQAAESAGSPGGAQRAAKLAEAVMRASAEDRGEHVGLDELLGSLAEDDGLRAEADSLRRLLTGEAEPDEDVDLDVEEHRLAAMRLKLPVSWFRDYPDPVHLHPLFTRCLPELRKRAAWPVPPTQVAADEGLEPDGYQIFVGDRLLASGHVDPARRYCTEETLALLPRQVRGDPRTVRTEHGWSIPESACTDSSGMTELLTMSAYEVVAQQYGEAARQIG